MCSCLPFKSEHEAKGVVLLDAFTFPKLVPSESFDLVVLVCNKAQIGDYGTDSIRGDFFVFASQVNTQSQGDSSHVLMAQILVNGGDNLKLAESLGAESGFQHPFMVVIPAGTSKPLRYPSNQPFTMRELTNFVSRHTSLYYQMPGTLKVFDKLAEDFLVESNTHYRSTILSDAEKELEKLTETGEIEVGEYYIKVMKKVLEKGDEHLQADIARLQNILDDASKVSKTKRRQLERHLNVLHHFLGFVQKKTSSAAGDHDSDSSKDEL